jgi:hypothetical protein
MHKFVRSFAIVSLGWTSILIPQAWGQDAKFDSDTISGLGARNIGSATMSGRISALAAVK